MIDRSIQDGVTLLQMQRDPANVLDLEFSEALTDAISDAQDDPETRAIVITGTGGVFSAGVDLFRLVDERADYLPRFIAAINRLFARARSGPKPIVAAINGHAIAGGGILALACDYRIITSGKATMGLPELKVGVPFPSSAISIVRASVPVSHHREVLLLGTNFGPEDARERGMVDEIADDGAVLERALEVAAELASIPPRSLAITRQIMALPEGADAADLDAEVLRVWGLDETRDHIREFLEKTFGGSGR